MRTEPKEPGNDTHQLLFEIVTCHVFVSFRIKKNNTDDDDGNEASHTLFATFPLIDTTFQHNVS